MRDLSKPITFLFFAYICFWLTACFIPPNLTPQQVSQGSYSPFYAKFINHQLTLTQMHLNNQNLHKAKASLDPILLLDPQNTHAIKLNKQIQNQLDYSPKRVPKFR